MRLFLFTTLALGRYSTMSYAQSSPISSSCYPTIDALLADISQKDPNEIVTYTLCGDTVYEIGSVYSQGKCCADGQAPLAFIGNSIIRCGDDGSSSNNCILRGGNVQMTMFNRALGPAAEQDNIVIQGLTFEGAKTAGMLLVSEGKITFDDCIIKDQSNMGAVSAFFSLSMLENRRFSTEISAIEESQQTIVEKYLYILNHAQAHEEFRAAAAQDPSRQRNSQEDSHRLIVTFKNCLFFNNTKGTPAFEGAPVNYGLVTAETADNDLIFEACTFKDNKFSDDLQGGDGYAIYAAAGATLSMHHNYFINNDFADAAVILEEESGLVESSGNFGTLDDAATCPFVASGAQYACIEYESDQCIATETKDEEDHCSGFLGFGLFARLPSLFCFTESSCGVIGKLFRFDRLGICTL